MTANILDTTATLIASTGINIIKERNHWFAIDTTPDKGFVLVVTAGEDRFHVYRYSDKAILLWHKEHINLGSIQTIVSLKEGGVLSEDLILLLLQLLPQIVTWPNLMMKGTCSGQKSNILKMS
jgi:hypothetical protein